MSWPFLHLGHQAVGLNCPLLSIEDSVQISPIGGLSEYYFVSKKKKHSTQVRNWDPDNIFIVKAILLLWLFLDSGELLGENKMNLSCEIQANKIQMNCGI